MCFAHMANICVKHIKKKFCFLYTPDEYNQLFEHFTKDEIGINLNIGHLNLASKTFGFSPNENHVLSNRGAAGGQETRHECTRACLERSVYY